MIWCALAGSLFILGLSTWDLTGEIAGQIILRRFSLPVLAIELTVVVAAAVSGFEPSTILRSAPPGVRLSLGLLTAIAIGTAVLVAPNPPIAVFRTCGLLLHLLFGLALLHLFAARWRPLRNLVWPSIVAGTLAYTLLVAVFVASIFNPESYDWDSFRLGASHVRHLGYYSAVGASVSLGLALTAERAGARRGWLGATAIIIAISFWSGTRGSLVALTAGFAIGAFAFRRLRSFRALMSFLFSMTLGLILSLVHQVPHPAYGVLRLFRSSAMGTADPSTGRFEIWVSTFHAVLERPLFGFGESQFKLIIPEAMGKFNHPHNILLQLLLQWGIVGTLCCLVMAAFILPRFDRAARRMGEGAVPAYLLVATMLVYALYDGTLYYPYPIAMLAIGITWVLVAERQSGVSATSGVFWERQSHNPPATIKAAPPSVGASGASPNSAQPSVPATSS